ncbi:NAD(P)/FAD-dependent oxidoreductase [Burkholderia multivorans]|uniref:NAD(P)/FAD-dependent oxidoreductase n=1 Tax=Burkholderia multivorans TaxID=87883 RepID=UPI0015928051|nr:NAD(P)/FAD-dependent oxidoreductase [Burkholderia multivorans]MCA8336439.1 NAD(P)/FAD-dependent oxidoreductase [Burkholderia multivorans]
MSADRIAVLGAGPMGLGVAYQLVKDGRKPIIFEADDRVGGMAACFDFGGLSIERYYHFHAISDHAFLKVLQELGLEDKMHWRETKMGYFYQGRVQPWGNPIALLKFKGLGLTAKIRYGIHAFLCTRRDDWKPLDKLEATAWIRRWVGEEAWEVLWRRLFDYKFYEYAQSLSAAWIWSRVRRIGRSRYNLFREKLGYLDGGSETLLEGMRRYIEANGGEFRLGTPVSKVVIENGRVAGVEAAGQSHAFDKVISTIPLPYVPRVMPDLPKDILEKFARVKNVAVVCVITKLRKPVTANFWLNTNDPDMDIPGIVEYTNLRPLDAHVVYVPFYVPGEHPLYQQADSVFIDKVKRYLMKINPAITPDDFIDVRASRYRFAQPVCEPGFADHLPPIQLPVEGLLVADTSYYYPEDRGISESIGLAREMARMV